MILWNELQPTLRSYFKVDVSPVLLVVVIGVLSLSFFSFFEYYDLPGPSFWQNFPNGEIYPLLKDSRATSRTLTKLSEKYGHIFQTWLGAKRTVVSSNPSDVAQILSNIDDFARPEELTSTLDVLLPGGLMTMPDKIHLIARKRLKDKFNFSLLDYCHDYLSGAIAELCQELETIAAQNGVDQLPKTIDITPALSTMSFRVVTNIAFGCEMSRKKRIEFYCLIELIIDEVLKDFLGYPFRQALTPFGVRKKLFRGLSQVNSICEELISKRLEETPEEKASRPLDTLDAILSIGQDSLRTIVSQAMVFVVGGSHTISQTLSWCIYELCCDRRVEVEVEREVNRISSSKPRSKPLTLEDVRRMTYLNKVWKEALRLHSPAALLLRKTRKDVVLRGSQVKLRKGTHVTAFLHGAHTNADIWREPTRFIPERWGSGSEQGEGDRVPKGSFVPFSIGQKSCLGKFLADYEGVLVLAELYRRFKFNLACDPSEVVTCTTMIEGPRYARDKNGDFDMGVPVQIQLRSQM